MEPQNGIKFVAIQFRSYHRVGSPMTRVSVTMDGNSQAAHGWQKASLGIGFAARC